MKNKKINKYEGFARTRCEVWTRTMGYFRPIVNFNVGKKSENRSRVKFSVPSA